MGKSGAVEGLSVRARLKISILAAAAMIAALLGLVIHALMQGAPWWQIALRLLVLIVATAWAVVGI